MTVFLWCLKKSPGSLFTIFLFVFARYLFIRIPIYFILIYFAFDIATWHSLYFPSNVFLRWQIFFWDLSPGCIFSLCSSFPLFSEAKSVAEVEAATTTTAVAAEAGWTAAAGEDAVASTVEARAECPWKCFRPRWWCRSWPRPHTITTTAESRPSQGSRASSQVKWLLLFVLFYKNCCFFQEIFLRYTKMLQVFFTPAWYHILF